MNIPSAVREEELHALIDGELDPADLKRVREAIEADAEMREWVERYRADKARLVAIYRGGIGEPLPQEWFAKINRVTARPRWRARVFWGAALAASFVLVCSGVVAWREMAHPQRDDVVAEALAARAGAIRPDAVVSAEQPQSVAAEAHAMTAALDARVHAPDLSRMGYRLVGIDVYSAPTRAFELRYAGRDDRIFTLYLRRSSGRPRFEQFREGGLRVCIWQDDVVGMVMAGQMSVAAMQRLASLAYTGLTL